MRSLRVCLRGHAYMYVYGAMVCMLLSPSEGGGIIGASIAYHLSLRGVAAIVVEQTRVAAAASGKAGGFLAGGCEYFLPCISIQWVGRHSLATRRSYGRS